MNRPAQFEHSEIFTRWSRLRRLMELDGIDVLMLNTEADFRYATGFHTPFWQSPTRTWTLLLPLSKPPVAVIPDIGEPLMSHTPVSDLVCYPSPHPSKKAAEALANTIKELKNQYPERNQFTIGIPMGPETHLRMPVADWNSLNEICDTRFVDATCVIQKTRMIKSAAEVSMIQYAAQAASRAFSKLSQKIRTGKSEREIFTTFKQLALDEGVDDIRYLVGGADQDGYRDIISPPTDRSLTERDVLIIDTGCTYNGYYCDFDRNFSIGKPSQRVQTAHHIAWDATEAALEIVQSNVAISDVYAAIDKVLSANGDNSPKDPGRLGHGLGSQLTEPPSITPFENRPLEAGMVMTIEPCFNYGDQHLMVHEENILVTDTGYELLTQRAPRDIPVVG